MNGDSLKLVPTRHGVYVSPHQGNVPFAIKRGIADAVCSPATDFAIEMTNEGGQCRITVRSVAGPGVSTDEFVAHLMRLDPDVVVLADPELSQLRALHDALKELGLTVEVASSPLARD